MTQLEFSGEWPFTPGLAIGLVLAGFAFILYRRETRSRRDALRWFLPLLRAFAVFLLVLMLAGPLLRHRKIAGQLGRIILCIDGSQSMSLPDPNLEPHRKFLALRARGQIARSGAPNFELATAAQQLAAAAATAGRARPQMRKAELQEIAAQIVAGLEKASAVLKTTVGSGLPETRKTQKQHLDETVAKARSLVKPNEEPAQWAAALNAFAVELSRQESALREEYANASASAISNLDSAAQAAYLRFSKKPRWNRAEGLLLDPLTGLLRPLASRHRIELRKLSGARAPWLWRSENPAKANATFPDSFDSEPVNATTDLASALKTFVNERRASERTAVVLFSDGQHNEGPSALEAARSLGAAGVPIYCIGFGSAIRPPDAAIIGVRVPKNVSPDEHLKGELIIKDELPAGQAFTIRIELAASNVWSKNLISSAQTSRQIPFDFPVMLSEAGLGEPRIRNAILNFQALIDPAENEACATNNSFAFAVRVIEEKPKILLIHGGPSWEFRFLRNLLEREGQWELNDLVEGVSGETGFRRGMRPGEFPSDKEELFTYSIIVLGEVPRAAFNTEELGWFNEFVEKHSGALFLIDGQQQMLSNYEASPLVNLLPVRWQNPTFVTGSFGLRAIDSDQSPIVFSSDSRTNALIWERLPGPHWSARVAPLPGSETLLELTGAEKPLSALVARRFGTGRVIYLSFDETWRWRYGAGDYYQAKFWDQLLRWSMTAPFAVENQNAALDSGEAMYLPGSKVLLRARLRDDFARPLDHAKAEASLLRDHLLFATIHLNPDEHQPGVYTAQTSELPEGNYEVRLKTGAPAPVEQNLVTSFMVHPAESVELAELACNESLLREMASLSGGAYLREEEAGRLTGLLQPISQGRVVENETILWQSGWWFGTIIFLFALEWSLRKRCGLL